MILFQDYDKGVITAQVIDAVVNLANKKEIPTVVDPKKRNFLTFVRKEECIKESYRKG